MFSEDALKYGKVNRFTVRYHAIEIKNDCSHANLVITSAVDRLLPWYARADGSHTQNEGAIIAEDNSRGQSCLWFCCELFFSYPALGSFIVAYKIDPRLAL